MKCLSLCCTVVLLRSASAGFQSTTAKYLQSVAVRRAVNPRSSNQNQGVYSGRSAVSVNSVSDLSSEEVRAVALSHYILKSHEEKLKAIAEVERRKNAEIDSLKLQMAGLQLKAGKPLSLAPSETSHQMIHQDFADMSREELVAKLVKYQCYMQKYMIDAQEQKRKAVQAAQDEAKKKWGEAMLRLQPAAPLAATTALSPLYAARNAAVSKAAAAGKSRWGDMEVQRVVQSSSGVATSPVSVAATTPSTPEKPRVIPSTVASFNGAAAPAKTPMAALSTPPKGAVPPPEVVAADHGLRANEHVGGLTLAERVAQGALANPADTTGAKLVSASSSPPALSRVEVLYTQRNLNVLAAAKAGKSRWGKQEIERVQSIVNSLPAAAGSTNHAVINGAADSPALEERVNLGARMLAKR